MSEVLCSVGCGKPVADDAYICPSCAYILDDLLGEIAGSSGIPGLAAELDVTLARMDRLGAQVGGRTPASIEKPLPYNAHASEKAADLRGVLAAWVRLVADETGDTLPPDVLAELARWLRKWVGWLRHHKAGGDAFREIRDAMREAKRAIDRKPDLWYAGPCNAAIDSAESCECSCHVGGASVRDCDVPGGCGMGHRTGSCDAELYAHPGAYNVVCRDCGTVYDVAARREWLFEALADRLFNSQEMARMMAYLGWGVRDSTIRGYVHKGLIVSHGTDAKSHPRYRLGDVINVAANGGKMAS